MEMINQRVRVTTGEHAGRYIGINFGGGLVTNPEMLADMPKPITGTKYSSCSQERAANTYTASAAAAVQKELKQAGHGSETVQA
jgi:hypothetical protein